MRNMPGFRATQDGKRLEISDFGRWYCENAPLLGKFSYDAVHIERAWVLYLLFLYKVSAYRYSCQ